MKQFRMRLPSLRANVQSTVTGFNATIGGGISASSTVLGVDQVNIEMKKLGVA